MSILSRLSKSPKDSLPRWVDSSHIEVFFSGSVSGVFVDGPKIIDSKDTAWDSAVSILKFRGKEAPKS
jgi:hypothetical protein